MLARRPTLDKPLEIAKFWKNRRRDTAVVVSLNTYQETNIVNVREHFVGADGCMRPTTKGIALSVLRLGELAASITKALAKARELNLIDGDGGAA